MTPTKTPQEAPHRLALLLPRALFLKAREKAAGEAQTLSSVIRALLIRWLKED